MQQTLNLNIFPQPSPPSFYNTQPEPNFRPQIFSHPHGPTMVASGMYKYSLEEQNPFDPFAFRTPPINHQENVERSLPIYDDNKNQDVEVVPETQYLDE
ncbi:hypothetical protein Hanom_Chr12g01133231 [Helianthus anomalus]